MLRKGFTLIEIIAVMAVLAILAGVLAPFVYRQILEGRQEATEKETSVLRMAMIGDPELKTGGVRTDYGYLGDMGVPPGGVTSSADDLKKLITQGGQPSYTFDSNLGIGAGWQGPYLQGSTEDEVTQDEFGSIYEYEVRDPSGWAGNDWIAKVTSLGPDKTNGTTDDIIIEIKKKESFARVFGYVNTPDGRPASNIACTIYYPSNGTLTSVTGSADSQGLYQIINIPFGQCSVTLDPKLQFAPGSAKTADLSEDLEFYATNFSTNDVDITYVTVEYSITPAAYYTQMKIAGNMVFEATFPPTRNGSGDAVDMSSTPETVTGSGVQFHPVVVHVSSPSTRVSDIDISKQDAGETIKVEILNFRDSNAFGGSPVDITGVQFTVTFQLSDATSSVVLLTPVSAGSPNCSSYTVFNRSGIDQLRVRGGGYANCTRIYSDESFTINGGETISIYNSANECNNDINPSPITFYDANAADSDVDCTVGWTGTVLADE